MPRACPACGSERTRPLSLLTKLRYRLNVCRICRSQFYTQERPGADPSEDGQYWEAYKFDLYGDQTIQRAFDERYLRVLETARDRVGEITSVFDIGCGIGNFVAFAASMGMRAIGSDVSPDAVDRARRRGLEAYVADDAVRQVPDGSVDALTMWDVIEHLISPRAVLEDVVPKVRHGGALLFETPDADFPIRGALLGLHRLTAGRVDLTSPMYYWEHKIYFTVDGLERLLGTVGVDVVDVTRATSVREKMSRQFAVNAGKGSWKAKMLKRAWPVLETGFRAAGRGNKLLVVAQRR